MGVLSPRLMNSARNIQCEYAIIKIMPIDWNDSSQLYQQGRWSLGEGDTDKARELLLASYHLAPHYKTAELLGEMFLDDGDLVEALKYLAAAAGLNRTPFRARYLLAKVWLALEEKDNAIDNLEEALRLKEDYQSARDLLESLG